LRCGAGGVCAAHGTLGAYVGCIALCAYEDGECVSRVACEDDADVACGLFAELIWQVVHDV
jgi:hypothetical protein